MGSLVRPVGLGVAHEAAVKMSVGRKMRKGKNKDVYWEDRTQLGVEDPL